jgi:cold shock CspA family protein
MPMTDQIAGTIARLGSGYGVIASDLDGEEYFFFHTALSRFGPAFDDLQIGDKVAFTPIEGETSGKFRDKLKAVDVRVTSWSA